MIRLLAIGAGLLALVQVPLALSAPTALLLVPSHLALGGLVSTGAILDGLDGWPARARRWGAFFVVATLAMIAALEVGARSRGAGLGYWGLPWICALGSAWAPPVVAELSAQLGRSRARSKLRALRRAK